MSKPRRRKSRTKSNERLLELLQLIHAFGSLGFLLSLASVSSETRLRRPR